ncbi:hypothetical protein AURANDRAFT_61005 [Aureococcus anophagefferens]|uniref:EF-hand domain-containing protein n=1 Tax=Aureococcus anophagefferens TaxID=44056 RepID=F0XYP9_AURAN|nr:hypothetical protein AURANDRAFT_61005 [Aureococcus anophagefferens]EGB11799.1 hypothetical protein AURANDRAFT_61005 [Aureococcus anophagefferens]|eukprot:XP_009032927.1 hypothetical protein AURANDRAFT_61005 [Aureococcus anophagefferens]
MNSLAAIAVLLALPRVTAQCAPGTVAFSEHVITTLADDGQSVFAVDVDGDGDADILTASNYDDTVAWYENDGSQSFAENVLTNSANGANFVFAADVDGDADVDVLASAGQDNSVTWFENDGSGGFTGNEITASDTFVTYVFAADVDGDGDVDVLSAAYSGETVKWFENDGSEGFTEHTIASSKAGSKCAFAIDVDGDGDVDVIGATRVPSGTGAATWYENDGSEGFTEHDIDSGYNLNPTPVFATDVDGDGDVDVLGGSEGSDQVKWYENDGAESFTAHVITDSADAVHTVRAEDIDGDGDVDAVSGSYSAKEVAWYENDGSQSFTKATIVSGDSFDGARPVFTIDVDGDGDVDVVAMAALVDTASWFENGCAGPTAAPTATPTPKATTFCTSVAFSERIITTLADGTRSLYAVDVDGDGDVDVLSASENDDTVAWYESDGSQSFTERIITNSADGSRSVFAIDVDGDGSIDALSADSGDDTVAWYENDGSQSFTERIVTTLADNVYSVYAIDLDGDGDVDALSASYTDDTVAWYENNGAQAFTERVITTLADSGGRLSALPEGGARRGGTGEAVGMILVVLFCVVVYGAIQGVVAVYARAARCCHVRMPKSRDKREFLSAARAVFDIIDVDGNGSLDRAEIVARVARPEVRAFLEDSGDETLQGLLWPGRLEAALGALDTNSDGKIDAREWGSAIEVALAKTFGDGGGERGDGDVVLAPAAVDRAPRADAWTFDESARVPAVDIDSAGSAVADFNAAEDASSPVPLALDEGAPEATPPASPGILVIRADDPSPESE